MAELFVGPTSSPHERAAAFIAALPRLHIYDLRRNLDDSCPVCLVPLTMVLAEDDSDIGDAGVTKLEGCGHMFCRRDLSVWIRGLHGNCPTCRHVFLDVNPADYSDDESSDDEFIPDDDNYHDDTDGLSDFGMDAEMDMEMDELWADGDDEYYEDEDESGGEYEDPVERMETDWGLSEGDTSSEGDSGYPLDELVDDDIAVSVAGEDAGTRSDNAALVAEEPK
ncbi:hypothetical protein PC9H_004766 [Pleurotus ostreatus]|uniref:RING-type domain-containing protein n=1 Tax=Pleurotus ostreatus TaxID=5322 RepID=A0A8H6ZZ85_PLEOS|nr:uncharacterized protein PC9H_004766 [Pleurotus ostreatus]KAF7432823.1 hypothetical protein PC9H_004766 [Pleurotus ostreatus]KAJ8698620.1 hypothetical protein PTI98_005310 [Pleurotus ostreatus]